MKHVRAISALGILMLMATMAFAARGPGAGGGPNRAQRGIGPGGDSEPSRFETARFAGSGLCASCHEGLFDEDGTEVSLVTEWKPSMMALAFIDPVWRAKVKSETLRLPDLAGAIEEKCVRCHGPMASVEALAAEETVAIFGDGFTNDEHYLHFAASEGVSCTLCHQIEDSPLLGTDAGASGAFTIGELPDRPRDRPLFGPYDGVLQSSMRGSVQYTPIQGVHLYRSEVCATCHDLKTDYFDENGELASSETTKFPEQAPYREWLESDFVPDGATPKECVDCHLIQTSGAPTAWSPEWLPLRDRFYRHTFFSENTLMLGIMSRYSEDLGITGDGIEEAIENGRNYLLDAATIEVTESSLVDGTLEFQLRISNRTGHKLPTSIPIRRVYLHVKVLDPAGGVAFESGRLNPDHSIEGVESDFDRTTFEPHYDTITSPDEVQIYQGIMGNVEEEVTYTLLRASHFKKDNRILPAGFDTTTAAEDLLPRGVAVGEENFVGGSDEITYRVGNMDRESYTVLIELLDQSLAYPFVQDLLVDEEDPVIGQFAEMYSTAPAVTELIASTEVIVER